MKIEYLHVSINISTYDRKRVLAPTFKKIWDAYKPTIDIFDESADTYRHNLHAILCNAYENYFRLLLAKSLEKASQRGILPSTSVDYTVYGDNTHFSIRGALSGHYASVAPFMTNAISTLTFNKYYDHCIGNWMQEIARCLRVHPEYMFKILKGEIDDSGIN